MARDLIGPFMQAMLACAVNQLRPAPGRALLQPGGQVAWDDCCDGQVWVRLVNQIPWAVQAPGACAPTHWGATLGVGVIRCVSVVDDQGVAPTVAAMTAEALQMTDDQAALSSAMQCCITDPRSARIQRWDPLGPQGGCAGGEWQVSVRFDNCACLEPPPEEPT